MQKRSRNLRLSTALIAPMLLITLASIAYAAISNSVSVNFTLKSGNMDPRITNYWVTEYCGYGYTITLTNSNKTLTVTDNLLFSGWKLNLTIEIENNSTMPLTLNYTITYLNGTDWIVINATRLFELTGIEYEDGFFEDFTCETPIDCEDFVFFPDDVVYKREYLSFNAQDSELQGQDVEFKVTINFYTE
jgi:hypothetical protein